VLGLSIGHWIIVLIVVVILFGPKRLPELGQSLGEGIKNFKKGLSDPTPPPAEKLNDKSDEPK
jgi:sec-independent protein translocase protein TatA